MLFIRHVIAALKHHVLKKMCKARFADLFTGRTYVVRNVYVHYRIAMIFVNDQGEPIGQYIFFVRNNNFITCFGNLFNQPRLAKTSMANNKKYNKQQPSFLFHYLFFLLQEKPKLPIYFGYC